MMDDVFSDDKDDPDEGTKGPKAFWVLGLVLSNRTEIRKSGGTRKIRTSDLLHAM